MFAMAVSANHIFEIRKQRFMLVGVDFVFGVTAHAERFDFRPGIHNLRRCAVTS
jgi:hypothetical protein